MISYKRQKWGEGGACLQLGGRHWAKEWGGLILAFKPAQAGGTGIGGRSGGSKGAKGSRGTYRHNTGI